MEFAVQVGPRERRRIWSVPVGAVLAAVLVLACGDDEPDAADASPTPAAATATAPASPTPTVAPVQTPTTAPAGTDTPVPTDQQELDFVRARLAEAMPDFDVAQVTGVQAEPGSLTLQTEWASDRSAEAAELCEQVAALQLSTATHIVITGSGGTTLAECDEET